MNMRNTAAVLGVVAILLAALIPSFAVVAFILSVALIAPALFVVIRYRALVITDDPPVALLALVSFRAPPTLV